MVPVKPFSVVALLSCLGPLAFELLGRVGERHASVSAKICAISVTFLSALSMGYFVRLPVGLRERDLQQTHAFSLVLLIVIPMLCIGALFVGGSADFRNMVVLLFIGVTIGLSLLNWRAVNEIARLTD